MILLTGAAGKTGRAVLAALARDGVLLRAFVRTDEQAELVRSLGAHQVYVGDLGDASDIAAAMSGATSVYLIAPNMAADEEAIGATAVEAARGSGVERFVYHSVLHPETEAMPHHWQKLRVEELLLQSGVPFTILQPAPYMQNVLAGWESIMDRGRYEIPYGTQTRLAMVDLVDVAETAVEVLTTPDHIGATYQLCGSDPLTQDQVAAQLERALGRPVEAVSIPLAKWEERARASGLGEYAINTLLAMFRYYDRYGLPGNANVLSHLLGRPPASFAQFADRAVGERR